MFKSLVRYTAAIALLFASFQLNAQDKDAHTATVDQSTTAEDHQVVSEDHNQTTESVESQKIHTSKEDSELNITELIMHHISDSHEWHFFDIDGQPYSLALPVIVYTKNGFSAFSSSVFHHNDNGEVVYTPRLTEIVS